MCMPECMPEEDIRSPGSGLIGGCEPPIVGGFGPLEKQEVLLTAELINFFSSSQTSCFFLHFDLPLLA